MTTTTEPIPQHMAALRRANAIRCERADLKRDVRMGVVDVRDLLREPPAVLAAGQGVTVTELLTWQPRWGIARSRKLLGPLHVGPFVKPHDLSRVRREQVARRLP